MACAVEHQDRSIPRTIFTWGQDFATTKALSGIRFRGPGRSGHNKLQAPERRLEGNLLLGVEGSSLGWY